MLRHLKTALFLILTLGCGAHALAQAWPAKGVIKWVLPFPPGGPADNLSRAIVGPLSDRLGQTVIVENRPGANGSIGAAMVAKTAPDGYTILFTTIAAQAINPHLYKDLPYDTLKDFAAISTVNDYVGILVVGTDSKVNTVADLVTAARAAPATLTYGSSGQGSGNHMQGEMFAAQSAARLVHVPYKGDAPAMVDLLSGRLSFMFTTIPFALQHEKSGKLRLLATTGVKRHPSVPHLPTMSETVPGMEFVAWLGLFAPAGTPKEILSRIASELGVVLALPALKGPLTGVDASPTTPELFTQRLQREHKLWGEIVRKAGIKVN